MVKKESAGIQFDPIPTINQTSRYSTPRIGGLTTTKDPNVIDLEEECQASLVDQLFFNDTSTSKWNIFGFGVKNIALLQGNMQSVVPAFETFLCWPCQWSELRLCKVAVLRILLDTRAEDLQGQIEMLIGIGPCLLAFRLPRPQMYRPFFSEWTMQTPVLSQREWNPPSDLHPKIQRLDFWQKYRWCGSDMYESWWASKVPRSSGLGLNKNVKARRPSKTAANPNPIHS